MAEAEILSCELVRGCRGTTVEGSGSCFRLRGPRRSSMSRLFLWYLARGWLIIYRFLFVLCFFCIIAANQTRIWPHYCLQSDVLSYLSIRSENCILAKKCFSLCLQSKEQNDNEGAEGVNHVWGPRCWTVKGRGNTHGPSSWFSP